MSAIEVWSDGYTAEQFRAEVNSAKMRTVLHAFNVLKHPEPYIANMLDEATEEEYRRFDEFDPFRKAWDINRRTESLRTYLGEIAAIYAPQTGDQLRVSLVGFAEEALTDDDRLVLVDAANNPVSPNQLLPDVPLIDVVARAVENNSCTPLNAFVEHSLSALDPQARQTLEGLVKDF